MNKDLFGNIIPEKDFADVIGQANAKRAIEVACVGNHNILMIGAKGSGKTMLVERISSITNTPLKVLEILPCPCGNFTNPKVACNCTPYQIQRHYSKIPYEKLKDIDIHIEIPKINLAVRRESYLSSSTMRKTIEQAKRNPIPENLDKESEELLKMAILELGISARAYDSIINIAKTIARMDNNDKVKAHHISEAIGYRALDRNYWV